MLEHVIPKYIRDFLAEHEVLSVYQHGFRQGMSTVTQLVSTSHNWFSALDMAAQVGVLFMDFCKAFDKVPHGKLLYKLESVGLPPCVIRWISAYLNNRQQFVQVQNFSSTMLPVTSGVPQGSVLGPLLFLIYINDLTEIIPDDVSIRLFADDCAVFKTISTANDHASLQSTIVAIHDWCANWGMALNREKNCRSTCNEKKISEPLHLLS